MSAQHSDFLHTLWWRYKRLFPDLLRYSQSAGFEISGVKSPVYKVTLLFKSILEKDDLVLHKKLKHSWHEGMCSSSRHSGDCRAFPQGSPALAPLQTQHHPTPPWPGSQAEPGTIVLSPTSQEHTSLLVLNSSWHLQRKAGLLQVAVTQWGNTEWQLRAGWM